MCCRMPRNVKRSGEAMTDNTQCHHAHDGHSGHDVKVSAGDKRYDKVPAGYSGAVYTCPMHPQVRQTGPGSCPICGMGLELESAAMAKEGSNPELVDFTRRFWIGTVLTLPLLVFTMGPFLGLGGVREVFGDRATLRSAEHTSELQSLMR